MFPLLTLLTDGVVEAHARTGESLIATLSTQCADSIVRAARDFSQEDDITVLTLSRPPRQP
jgi:serine phosphatase RsbU (regulator of sigma subunit)